jgi:hypothetical protein
MTNKKGGQRPPTAVPAAAPTVRFSRILNLNNQSTAVSREIRKKDSGTGSTSVPESLVVAINYLDGYRSPHIAVGNCLGVVRSRRQAGAHQVHERLANFP